MSSFIEQFRKSSQTQQLEYDDAASNYFAISILGVVFVILLASLFMSLFKSKPKSKPSSSQLKNRKLQANKSAQPKSESKINLGTIAKVIFVIIITLLLAKFYSLSKQNSEALKDFDPYRILEISKEATQAEIVKAYRKLAKKWHPDKNPDNPEATAKFIKITKAHQCLTDEKQKRNYELYGNPDGPGTLNLSIALPTFILKKENQIDILMAFLVIVVILIPSIGFYYINKAEHQLDELKRPTIRYYFENTNENTTVTQAINLICNSDEIALMGKKDTSQQHSILLKRLHTDLLYDKQIPNDIQKALKLLLEIKNPKDDKEFRKKEGSIALTLLVGYLTQYEQIKQFDLTITSMIENIDKIFNQLLDIALQKNFFLRYRQLWPDYYNAEAHKEIHQLKTRGIVFNEEKRLPYIGLRPIISIIKAQQLITQGIWVNDQDIYQFSEFRDDDVQRQISRKIKNIPSLQKLQQEYYGPEDQQAQLKKLYTFLSEQDIESVNNALGEIPYVTIEYDMFVQDAESTINEIVKRKEFECNDLITIEFKLKQQKKYPTDNIYSVSYPFLKKDKWYVFLVDDIHDEIIGYLKIQGDEDLSEKFQVFVQHQAKYKFKLIFMNDSYKGLDQEITLQEINVKADTKKISYTKEDIELSQQKSAVEKLGENLIGDQDQYQVKNNQNKDNNSDEEEEEDDDDENDDGGDDE